MNTKKTFDTPRKALEYLVPKMMEYLEYIPVKIPPFIREKQYEYKYTKYIPGQPYSPPKRVYKGFKYDHSLTKRILYIQFKLRCKVRRKMKLVQGFSRAKKDSGLWPALTVPGVISRAKLYKLYKKDKVKFKEAMRLWAISEVVKVRALVGPQGALCWRLKDDLIMVKPPHTFLMDKYGFPHADSGPAVAWDGEEYYFSHGRLLKNPILQDTDNLDVDKLWRLVKESVKHIRVQRVLQAIGPKKVLKLLGAKITNKFSTPNSEFRLLKAKLISRGMLYTVAGLKIIESTGVRVIGVDPDIKTAKEALKSVVEDKFTTAQQDDIDQWGTRIRKNMNWVNKRLV